MNLITLAWTGLVAFVLCQGLAENKISVKFAVRDCESNCISAKNPNGKVRIYGYDSKSPMIDTDREIVFWEIIEQPFTATSVPFTLDIVYPEDPAAIIRSALTTESMTYDPTNEIEPVYFVDIIWDADENFVSNCNDDVRIDGKPRTDAVVDLNSAETQNIYIKLEDESQGTCEGSIKVKFITKECDEKAAEGYASYTYCKYNGDVAQGYAKVSLYGYDDRVADTSGTLIHQEDTLIYATVARQQLTISFPENPINLIQNLNDATDAKFYVTLEKCDLSIDNDYYDGVANVDLMARDRVQNVYIKETINEDIPCGAACHYKTFVKVLLPFFFIFYILM